MSATNPYDAPRASLSDPAPRQARPAGVWAIFLVFMLYGGITLLAGSVILWGYLLLATQVDEAVRLAFARTSHWGLAMSLCYSVVGVFSAVQIFRLKRSSLYLFAALFLWQLFEFGWVLTQGVSLAGRAVSGGWLLALLTVCVYVARLFRKGVLQADRARPLWLWVLLAYFLFVSLGNSQMTIVVYSGLVQLQPLPGHRDPASMTALDLAVSLAYWALSLVAAVQLFRLRRTGLALCWLAWGVGLLGSMWQATQGWVVSWRDDNLWWGVGYLSVSLIACLYARHLKKTGWFEPAPLAQADGRF